MSTPVFCHGCGQPLEIPDDYQKTKMRCPQCGVMCDLPEPGPRRPKPSRPESKPKPVRRPADVPEEAIAVAPSSKPRKQARPPRPVIPKPPGHKTSQDDDGLPYDVSGGEEMRCPDCGKILDEGAVLCLRCGLNLQTGEKAEQTFQPLERHWNTGWSFRTRLIAYVLGLSLAFASGTTAILLGGDVCTFVTTFTTFVVMFGFLIGTWDSLDLERNSKGKTKLTKTWRAFFWVVSVKKINLGNYQGVTTGKSHDVTLMDWIICFILMTWGLIPGIVFIYLAFFKHTFYAALVREHGRVDFMLYRGWDEAQMKEIEHVVRDAGRWKADLPVEK